MTALQEVPSPAEPPLEVRSLVHVNDADQIGSPDLSEFFNPFLSRFLRDALEGHLDVHVAEREGQVVGISTYDPVESVGAIFTRHRKVAETFFAQCPTGGVFSDFPLGPGAEAYEVYAMGLDGGALPHRFSHRVRVAEQRDREVVVDLMRKLYGPVRDDWLRSIPRAREPCFLAEVDGEVAGVGWVTAVDGEGRLHTLSVRPRYRRMQVGTDLWYARMLWARHEGVRRVICEIGEHNVASRGIASAGGMSIVGRIFLTHRPVAPPGA